ncbi:MAG: transposase [Bacilli bacterium]|nr:transposase [Bacilli bacterium]
MGRKSKYTIEQKIEAVLDYKSGKRGTYQICKDLGLDQSGVTLYKWIHIYEDFGEVGFLPKQKNKSYSKELKEEAVKEYLAGNGSFRDIARKYEISSNSILVGWVSKYNGYEKLKDYNPKGEVYMTKGRKTTLEERQEIVV